MLQMAQRLKYISKKIESEKIDKTLEITENFFETENDPNQIPINKDSEDKILSIHKDAIIVKNDENDEPIAWCVIIPTSIDTMNKFLNKEITEKELMNIACIEKKFEALYLCSVFVIPEYRNKGYAKNLMTEGINKLQGNNQTPLYYWAYSNEGKELVNSLSKSLNRQILELKNI